MSKQKEQPVAEEICEEAAKAQEEGVGTEGETVEANCEAPPEQTGESASPGDEEMQVKYLRLAADFQNYKRRVEKEKSDIYAFANEKIAVELLNVIDNFDRSLAMQGECKDEKMLEGMKLIFKQLKDVLEKNSIKEIDAENTDFDPNFHHAVMTDSSGEYESGKVTEVLQKGYTLNEKVIRPAMVKVAE